MGHPSEPKAVGVNHSSSLIPGKSDCRTKIVFETASKPLPGIAPKSLLPDSDPREIDANPERKGRK